MRAEGADKPCAELAFWQDDTTFETLAESKRCLPLRLSAVRCVVRDRLNVSTPASSASACCCASRCPRESHGGFVWWLCTEVQGATFYPDDRSVVLLMLGQDDEKTIMTLPAKGLSPLHTRVVGCLAPCVLSLLAAAPPAAACSRVRRIGSHACPHVAPFGVPQLSLSRDGPCNAQCRSRTTASTAAAAPCARSDTCWSSAKGSRNSATRARRRSPSTRSDSAVGSCCPLLRRLVHSLAACWQPGCSFAVR